MVTLCAACFTWAIKVAGSWPTLRRGEEAICGIGAIVRPQSSTGGYEIKRMLDIVRHRGPDDEGYALFDLSSESVAALSGPDTPRSEGAMSFSPTRFIAAAHNDRWHVALGHRRLSILDLSNLGHQPMCDAEGDYWVVYNGEIYNYLEIAAELKVRGHKFRSHCDTEVLLAAYREWGTESVFRLNGMFAFVLLDRRRRVVFAARDRFGVKPLYYWISPVGLIALASEIKQFTTLPGWKPHLNGQRAYDYLNWSLQDHTDETLFDGVRQLRPGEFFEVSLGANGAATPMPRRWYQLTPREFSGSDADATDTFRTLLRDSVRLRLQADVPVGSCLSGGLDSSSIVCLVSELLRQRGVSGAQNTFSAESDIPAFDERPYAELAAEKAGANAHYIRPNPDRLFEELDRLTWHQDEPFGSTSIFAQSCVFALAAENRIKVMLDGQGSDELLAGYHTFFAPHLAHLAVNLRWLRLGREMKGLHDHHGLSGVAMATLIGGSLLPPMLKRVARRLAGRTTYEPDWIDLRNLAAAPIDPTDQRGGRSLSVNQVSQAQLTGTNLQMLLHWEDRNSMAYSVEARVPFLDYRLVEFVLGLPPHMKIRNGTTKWVLRQSMKGTLPEAIRLRQDKLGFVTAEENWVREQRRERFRALADSALATAGTILTPLARKRTEAILSGTVPFSSLLWRIISFGRWCEVFEVSV